MIIIKSEADKVIIKGHANYNDDLDIVCASVSSIMYTTVNAMKRFKEDSLHYEDDGREVIIEVIDKSRENEVLITNMMSLFQELASKYPKNVKIESEEY